MPRTTLHERLLKRAGLWDYEPAPFAGAYDALASSEWSKPFETLMRNRLIMGALRYGRIGAPNKPKWNRVASIKKRTGLYEESGNLELLVDIANLCLLEFVEGQHPKRHWHGADGDSGHVTL